MKNNLKIAFLGGIFPLEIENEINKNSINHPQNAANVFQWNILRGIDSFLDNPITVLNAMFIGSYPLLYKKAFIKKGKFNHSVVETHVDYQLPFLNLPLIKHISRAESYKNYINEYVSNKDYNIIMGYSMTLSVVWGLMYAKKKNPGLKTCLVVPDLPEFMNMNKQSWLMSKIKKWSNKKLYGYVKQIDSFVVLTSHMPESLGIADKPHVVIEGIVTPQKLSDISIEDCSFKKIVYTGALHEKYGAKALVDAFVRLDNEDVQLCLYGSGDMVDYIKEISTRDSRVQYCGIVPHKEIRLIQEEAYLLVNPRNSNEEYTKYSFPSKTMEYMDAGRPVLMYPLPGIPDEYDNYLLYVDPNDEDGLYKALRESLNIPSVELNNMGKKSKEFVEQQKNYIVQGKKIKYMLDDLL